MVNGKEGSPPQGLSEARQGNSCFVVRRLKRRGGVPSGVVDGIAISVGTSPRPFRDRQSPPSLPSEAPMRRPSDPAGVGSITIKRQFKKKINLKNIFFQFLQSFDSRDSILLGTE